MQVSHPVMENLRRSVMNDRILKLILVKHSLPEFVPDLPPAEWRLAETGRRRSQILAQRLAAFQPGAIFSSPEHKAEETARIVGAALDLPVEIVPGLHEHRRQAFRTGDEAGFEQSIAALFAQPDRLVFGLETADEAQARFSTALFSLLQRDHLPDTILAIAHGTVISLFVSRQTGLDPFHLWKRLGLPSFIILHYPGFILQEVVEQVG
jgi:broad specificity phosphatase PhoE